MNIHRSAYAAVVAVALSQTTGAQAQQPRAVVELFTSQGCSSCPAADKVLREVARDPSVIALSLNVDYWDYLGWKDTLALHGHTNRQRAYAGARNDRNVYTPQVVVNGTAQLIGSDRAAVDAAISAAKRTASVPVAMKVEGGKVLITVAAATDDRKAAEIWLCPVSSRVSLAIGRGENKGENLTYTNVVRRWIKLGDWNGEEKTYAVPVNELANAEVAAKDFDSVAVVVQSGAASKPGPMLGAAIASLKQ